MSEAIARHRLAMADVDGDTPAPPDKDNAPARRSDVVLSPSVSSEEGERRADDRHRGVDATMYVVLLREAFETWVSALSGEELVDHVVACRVALLRATMPPRDAYLALAEEIAYDRSLIRLAQAEGVLASPAEFANPSKARDRIEGELRARARARERGDSSTSG